MSVHRVVAIADLHVGSTVSLWPEGAALPDGGAWQLSRPQRMLARHWDTMLEELLAYEHIDAIVTVGDLVDGCNPRAGLITDRMDYQRAAAVELLAPLRELAARFYVVRGSEWHTGKGDEYVSAIAEELGATPIPSTGEVTWPELFYDMGGLVVHFAHHIGATLNPMYEATAALRDLMTLRLELLNKYGLLAPDVWATVRAHRHRTIAICKDGRWSIVLAGWKLKDNYAYRVAVNTLPEIAYAVLESDGDTLTVRTRAFPLSLPHVERPEG